MQSLGCRGSHFTFQIRDRWTAWKMEDGSVMTATICNDKAGCDNSIHVAREWVGKNAAHLGLQAPLISEGELVHQIMA